MDSLKPFTKDMGISEEQVTILTAHYPTVLDFLDVDRDVVVSTIPEAAIPAKVIKKLRQVILDQLISETELTGNDLFSAYQDGFPLSFGLQELDDMSKGELRSSEVLEICGIPLSGKTQVCLQLICYNLLNVDSRIVVVDTGSQISPLRIADILRLWGHGGDKLEECLQRLTVITATTVLRALQTLDYVASFLRLSLDRRRSEGLSTRSIVVVDSVYAVVAPILSGNKTEGFALMSRLAFSMKYIASELQAAVVYTNSKPATEDPDAEMQANLGVFWQSVPHHRIFVHQVGEFHVDSLIARAGHPTEIVVALIKSTKMPTNISVSVCITPAGLSKKTEPSHAKEISSLKPARSSSPPFIQNEP